MNVDRLEMQKELINLQNSKVLLTSSEFQCCNTLDKNYIDKLNVDI